MTKLAMHRRSYGDSGYWIGEEEVSGIVIGDYTHEYVFLRTFTIPGVLTWTEPVARGSFVDDDEAIAWLKEHRPDDYAAGVEMRVHE